MTLPEIVAELEKLEGIQFALVTRERTAGLGGEALHMSLREDGAPDHPVRATWLLFRGIQRALDLCSDVGWAADMSLKVSKLSMGLDNWTGSGEF